MSQIINITSEALQATIRRLLPSQQGFGEDLQASNVILPVIDLTPTAEGSALPTDLARALAFNSQTSFAVSNTTSVIVNTAGFYRVYGVSSLDSATGSTIRTEFSMSDGLSSKDLWEHVATARPTKTSTALLFDFTVFLDSGDSLSATTTSANAFLRGSTRQVADLNGNIVNPAGFAFQ